MNGRKTGNQGRVIILKRGTTDLAEHLNRLQAGGAEIVSVDNAYEAAAELLAGPGVVLIVDLSLLPRRHLRLLEIGRELETEMLVMGSLEGFNCDDLRGVRLISQEDLAAAVGRVLDAEAAEAVAASEETERSVETPTGAAGEESDHHEQPKPAAGIYEPTRTEDVLTNEELSALLENEP